MCNRNHMKVVTPLSIHHKVREVTKQNTPGTISSPYARNHTANPWMPQDQLKQASRFGKELRAQSLLQHLIPRHNPPQFLLSRRINTEVFHFASNSFSMRWRTSCHSERVVAPASTAAQRRSISVAQASSTSGSTSRSRLSNKRAASSARWSWGRESTSSKIRSVVSDMSCLYHERDTRDRLTAHKSVHLIAALSRFLLNLKSSGLSSERFLQTRLMPYDNLAWNSPDRASKRRNCHRVKHIDHLLPGENQHGALLVWPIKAEVPNLPTIHSRPHFRARMRGPNSSGCTGCLR